MKKILKYLFSLFLFISIVISCSDNDTDYIFEKSVNERFEDIKTSHQNIFINSEYGWKGFYSPNSNKIGEFNIHLDFLDDKRVAIHSDYLVGENNDTITYRIDKTLQAEIVFESYAVFHKMYELDQNTIGGEFVFYINEATDNKIKLTSKTDIGNNKTVLELTKAGASDNEFTPIYNMENYLAPDILKSPFRNIRINGVAVASTSIFKKSRRKLEVIYNDENGEQVVIDKPIRITSNGFCFLEPLVFASDTISCFTHQGDGRFTNSDINAEFLYVNVPFAIKEFTLWDSQTYLAMTHLDTDPELKEPDDFQSSPKFKQIVDSIKNELQTELGLRLTGFSAWLKTTPPYYSFTTYDSNDDERSIWFDYTPVKTGNLIVMTATGDTNASDEEKEILKPLVDLLTHPDGMYIQDMGKLTNYPNTTIALISKNDPLVLIHCWTDTN